MKPRLKSTAIEFSATRRDAMRLLGGVGLASALPLLPLEAVHAADQSKQKSSGKVVMAFSSEPAVFNPLFLYKDIDQAIFSEVFDPLWFFNEKGLPVPYLAESIPTVENGGLSADRLHWKIKLRSGVKWHDGTPFTADDVKFTLELINNPSFKAGRRLGHDLVRDIKVNSPTEIEWRTEKPFSPYMSILGRTWIVPKHILGAEKDPNSAPFNNAPIGTGPYKWTARKPGDHIELTANEDYVRGTPAIKTVIIKYVPDVNVMYTQLQTGDIDFLGQNGMPANLVKEASALPDRTVVKAPSGTIEVLLFNMERPQFKAPEVRQAIYMAVDKRAITEDVRYGTVSATESCYPASSPYLNPNLPKQSFSIAKANALLDQNGWKRGTDGIREKAGVKLKFDINSASGDELREQAQQLLQQNWQEIGVAVTIRNFPAAVVWGDVWTKSQFDMLLTGLNFMLGTDPDVSNYFSSARIPVRGNGGSNVAQYANPQVDKLLAAGAATYDTKERRAIYQELQSIVRTDLPFLPLYQWTTIVGSKARLKGMQPMDSSPDLTWNLSTWRWA